MGYTNFVNGNKPNLSAPNLNNMQIELMKLVFPIGSTYITQTDINPSTVLKFGTWERVKGKVLVGLDENDTAFNAIGKKGGEKTHTLSIDEMPSHNHSNQYYVNAGLEGGTDRLLAYGSSSAPVNTGLPTLENGKNQPHNILQPYQVVGYMWIRTA
jgi:general stress protein YciG